MRSSIYLTSIQTFKQLISPSKNVTMSEEIELTPAKFVIQGQLRNKSKTADNVDRAGNITAHYGLRVAYTIRITACILFSTIQG